MVDLDTFLTTWSVMADTFCNTLPPVPQPGPQASLSPSEVLTLPLVGQWARFQSERAFYRFAAQHLRGAFPTLPKRSQFNRLLRQHRDTISRFATSLVDLLQARQGAYETLDCSGVPTRTAKRRGRGWLPGLADIGWSNRLGWYEGFHLIMAVTPDGVITGFGFGAASTKDQPLADTFFAVRHTPNARLASVGPAANGPYVVDTGVEGTSNHQAWATQYQALRERRAKKRQPTSTATRAFYTLRHPFDRVRAAPTLGSAAAPRGAAREAGAGARTRVIPRLFTAQPGGVVKPHPRAAATATSGRRVHARTLPKWAPSLP